MHVKSTSIHHSLPLNETLSNFYLPFSCNFKVYFLDKPRKYRLLFWCLADAEDRYLSRIIPYIWWWYNRWHLSSSLFLGRFSGFIDFSLVFVHVKSMRCLPAFSFEASMLLSNLWLPKAIYTKQFLSKSLFLWLWHHGHCDVR